MIKLNQTEIHKLKTKPTRMVEISIQNKLKNSLKRIF